ncbi:MAG: hypothetical protein V1702_04730 [Candidatus Woesearchaeota archaeon]
MGKGSEKRVNIGLNEAIHTQAKLIAVLTRVNLEDYLKKAIEDAVKKDKKLLEEVAKK